MFKKVILGIITTSTLLITSVSYAISKDYLITSNSIGKVKLGMKKSDVKVLYKSLKTIDGNTFQIIDNLNFSLMDIYFDKSNKVNYIRTCSDEFLTKEGISPNSTLKTISKIYPDMEISMDGEQGSEQFFPKNYNTKTNSMEISLEDNLGILGKYSNSNSTKNFNKNGKVTCISIFLK